MPLAEGDKRRCQSCLGAGDTVHSQSNASKSDLERISHLLSTEYPQVNKSFPGLFCRIQPLCCVCYAEYSCYLMSERLHCRS